MNKERLNRVIEQIKAEPTHFVMSDWVNTGDPKDLEALRCGTAGCIGGWIETLARADEHKGLFVLGTPVYGGQFNGGTIANKWLEIYDDPSQSGADLRGELDSLFHMDRGDLDMEI